MSEYDRLLELAPPDTSNSFAPGTTVPQNAVDEAASTMANENEYDRLLKIAPPDNEESQNREQMLTGMHLADSAMHLLTLPMNLPPDFTPEQKAQKDLEQEAMRNVAQTDEAMRYTAPAALNEDWRSPTRRFVDDVKMDTAVNMDALKEHLGRLGDYTGVNQMLGHAGLKSEETLLPKEGFPFMSDSPVDRFVRNLADQVTPDSAKPAVRGFVTGVRDQVSGAATPQNVAIIMGAAALGPEAIASRLLSLGFGAQMIPGVVRSVMEGIHEPDPEKRYYDVASALTQGIFAHGGIKHGLKGAPPVEAGPVKSAFVNRFENPLPEEAPTSAETQYGREVGVHDVFSGISPKPVDRVSSFDNPELGTLPDPIRERIQRNYGLQDEVTKLQAQLDQTSPRAAVKRRIIQTQIDELKQRMARPEEVKPSAPPITREELQRTIAATEPETTPASPVAETPKAQEEAPQRSQPVPPNEPSEGTGISEASIEEQRSKLGLDRIEREKQIDFGSNLAQANARIAKDQSLPDRFINDLERNPHMVEVTDTPILIQGMQNARNRFYRAAEAVAEAAKGTDQKAIDRAHAELKDARENYDRVTKVVKRSTSGGGALLGSYRMMVKDDLSIGGIRAQVESEANKGKPLTPEQEPVVAELAAKASEAQARVDAARAKDAALQAEQEIYEKGLQPEAVDDHVANARARLRKSLGQANLFADPAVIRDLAIVGSHHIREGATKFSDWSKRMLDEHGPRIRPMLARIYSHARDLARSITGKNILPHAQERGGINLAGNRIKSQPQTNTKEFKEWFGKSKVVDEKGDPLVVYHGTNEQRNVFDGGAFFTDSKGDASAYAEMKTLEHAMSDNGALNEIVSEIMSEEGAEAITDLGPNQIREIADANGIELKAGKGVVEPVYIRAENPLDLTNYGSDVGNVGALWDKLHKEGLLDESWSSLDEDARYEIQDDYKGKAIYKLLENEGIQSKAFAKGFDAVKFEDMSPDGKTSHTSWLTKDNTQVKSATRNSGAFSRLNPDIGGGIDVTTGGSHSRIGERLITGKSATEENGPHLKVDLESALKHPKSFETNTNAIKKYSFLRDVTGKSPIEVAEAYIEHFKDNLLWLHDKMPKAWRDRTKQWYPGGHKLTHEIATRYEITHEASAGVAAALSPQQDWFRNISLAHRVIDAVKKHSSDPWNDAMEKTMQRIYKKDVYAKLRDEIQGKSLDQIKGRLARAAWVRTYDEAMNPRSYHIVTPEGEYGPLKRNKDGKIAKVGWGSNREIAKAMDILADPTPENISKRLGRNHKVRNFYNDLIDPENKEGSITVDTHAVAGGIMLPVSGTSKEVAQNFGSSGTSSSNTTGALGLYPFNAEAYRRAAKARGLRANAMQSIAWEAIRGIFRPEFKRNKVMVAAAREIWDRYGRGEIDASAARNQIFKLAGGMEKPDWVDTPATGRGGRSDRVSPEGEHPPNEKELSPVRVPTGRAGGSGDVRGTAAGVSEPARVGLGFDPLGFVERHEAAARERIKGKRGRLNIGVDPTHLVDEAIIGAAHIARGIKKFPEWSEKMRSEFGDHVEPHLRKIYERSMRMANARPRDDRKRQAAALKRRLSKTEEIKTKLENDDLSTPAPRTKIPMNDELRKAEADLQRVRDELQKRIAQWEREQWSGTRRNVDRFVRAQRAIKLTGITTLGKLYGAGASGLITAPIEEAVGGILSKIPILSKVAEAAPTEGGFSLASEGAAYRGLARGVRDIPKVLRGERTDTEALYGKKKDLRTESGPLEYPGRAHGAIKAPFKEAAFERSFTKQAIKSKLSEKTGDEATNLRQLIGERAYQKGLRAIFMQDNLLTDMYQSGIQRAEKSKNFPDAGHYTAQAMRFFMPIVKVPTNVALEAGLHMPLVGPAIATGKLIKVMRRGLSTIEPHEADMIMRFYKKGLVGAALFATGYFNHDNFGGFYQPGEKRDKNDVKWGGARILGVNIPAWLMHSPALIAIQAGATAGRLVHMKKKGKEVGTAGDAIRGVTEGIMEEIPFVSEMANITKLLAAGYEGEKARGRLVTGSIVPQGVQNVAKWVNPQDRSPKSVMDYVRHGIPGADDVTLPVPGLRERVPLKKKKGGAPWRQ